MCWWPVSVVPEKIAQNPYLPNGPLPPFSAEPFPVRVRTERVSGGREKEREKWVRDSVREQEKKMGRERKSKKGERKKRRE